MVRIGSVNLREADWNDIYEDSRNCSMFVKNFVRKTWTSNEMFNRCLNLTEEMAEKEPDRKVLTPEKKDAIASNYFTVIISY